ncbi:MAG: hypothetical protein QXL00_07595 [Conexivisphaerales archaeon]
MEGVYHKVNSTRKSRGYVRSNVVREFLNDPTACRHRYVQRWKRCLLMLKEYVPSVLDAGIFNEIIAKVFTYNVVEAHRGGTRVSWTKGHLP